jgi:DNA-binding SARP family transcriptional activator
MHVATAKVELAGHEVVLPQPETLCDLSVASWLGGVPQLARELSAEALASSISLGMPWSQTRAALLGALVADDEATADALLTDALSLTELHGYQELWARKERSRAPRLLARALERELGPPGVAAGLVAACGAEVVSECVALLADAPPRARRQLAGVAGEVPGTDPEMLRRLRQDRDPAVRRAATRSHAGVSVASERPPLRFVGLGGFAVHRGDELVPSSAFGRQRARALLAALLCAGRPVHREELLDWFWSDLDGERGLRALHVTLYGLRRALEPELPRGAASSVVVAEGESYRMRPADGDIWDAAEFLELVRVSTRIGERDARLDALRRAEAAYTGPLFPEWPYERWSEDRRVEVANALRTTLAQLGENLTDAGMVREAIACYQRLTALEPECEAWHRALMVTYERAGERAFALRQYHACRKVLRDELGVEASAETRDLHQAILNGRGAAG